MHLEASGLLRNSTGKSNENLRTAAADDFARNQVLLVQEFQLAVAQSASRLILFDGHSVIDGADGYLEISSDVIAGLRLDAIIFVHDDTLAIAARRAKDTRIRPIRSTAQLREYQELALTVARRMAEKATIPLTLVSAGDVQGFCDAAFPR